MLHMFYHFATVYIVLGKKRLNKIKIETIKDFNRI